MQSLALPLGHVAIRVALYWLPLPVTRAFAAKSAGFSGERHCNGDDCANVRAEAVNRHSAGSAEDAASSGKAVAGQSKAVKRREL